MKTIVLQPMAAKTLDKMNQAARMQILDAIHTYAMTGRGDTKAMAASSTARMLTGDFRIIFDEYPEKITILALGHRREIYRQGNKMGIQTITTENGDQLVVLSRRDYDALLAQLGDESAEDRMTLLIAAESRSEQPLPQPVSQAILAGESVIKAIRLWRGMTQMELAQAAGVTQSFLSEMEARNKSGSGNTLAKLAKTLDVPQGWLG